MEITDILKRFYLFTFRARGMEEEREGERHQCERDSSISCFSHAPNQADLTSNPSTCPDWELNPQPFSSQAGTQSTELHQPGHIYLLLERQTDKQTDRHNHV